MASHNTDSFMELPLASEASELDIEGTSDEQPDGTGRCNARGRRTIGKGLVIGLFSTALVILALPYFFHAKNYANAFVFPGSRSNTEAAVSLEETDPLASAAMGMPGIPTQNVAKEDECSDSEEVMMGMCFKKCSSWHNGQYPKRKAPFMCCHETCTSLTDCCSLTAPIPGHGYFIEGDGTTPSVAGTCDSNEELFLSLCYKTCSALTNDQFPKRVGPNSCCKATGSCLNIFFNVRTRGMGCNGYGVGGNLQSAHNCPHPPQTAETSSSR